MLGAISSLRCSVGCNVPRHHISRVQIVYLVLSSLPVCESCLNQVFPHFSSVVLFHTISIWFAHLQQLKSELPLWAIILRLSKAMDAGRCLLQIPCLFSYLQAALRFKQGRVPHGKGRTVPLIPIVIASPLMDRVPLLITLWATGNSVSS